MKIQKKNVNVIIDKISKLVDIYAKHHKLENCVVKEYCAIDIPYDDTGLMNQRAYVTQFYITKINFKLLMSTSYEEEIRKFVNVLGNLLSDTEIEILFIKKFYPDYLIIYNSLQKIIYDLPKEASEEDFAELNKLYKKYTVEESDDIRT